MTLAHRADPSGGFRWNTSISTAYVAEPMTGMGNLVRYCREDAFKVCPGLAESWEPNADFTEWTFKVRSGVVWHDGKPFDAQSAREALALMIFGYGKRPPETDALQWGDISKVETLDGNRVRVTLKASTPGYLALMAFSGNYFAYAPHLIEAQVDQGKPNVTNVEVGIVGVGPFKLKDYVKGSLVSVRKFDKYWEKDSAGRQLPYLDGIDYPIIKDRETVIAALRAGRIDGGARGAGFQLLPDQKEVLKKQYGDGVFFIEEATATNGLRFNTVAQGPFKDVRVRKAVFLAYDRQAYQDIFYPGTKPRPFFLPGSPFANPDFMTWPGYNPATREKDVADAKRLLAEAGFPGGFKTKFLCRAQWASECEFNVTQLSKVGIQAEMEMLDDATYDKRGCEGTFEVGIASGPNEVQLIPWSGKQAFGTVNVNPCASVRHDNAKIDDLFDRMAKSPGGDDYYAATRELERILLPEQALYIINHSPREYPYRSYIKGLIPAMSDFRNYLDNAWVWLSK